MTYFNSGEQVVNVDGNLVEYDALRIVEKLKEYDPNIEVLCNTENTDINEAPFIICERLPDGDTGGTCLVRIFEAWELDDRIIDRIRMSDRGSAEIKLGLLTEDIAKKKEKRYRDIMDQNKELVTSIIATRQSVYTIRDPRTGDIIKFRDDRPATRLTDTKVF